MGGGPSKGGLEARLGYGFRDHGLLEQALTHPSSGATPHNQRLEFLGDTLLGAAVTLVLFQEKPQWSEGQLSKLRHQLVSTDTLQAWAEDLGLELRTGKAIRQGKQRTAFRKPLADGLEALLAAVFLDCQARGEDGLAVIRRLVEARFATFIREADLGVWESHDPKTTLQERAAAQGLPAPAYGLLARTGPDHAPRFRVKVQVGPHTAEAEGPTLKRAEAEAARALLPQLAKEAPAS